MILVRRTLISVAEWPSLQRQLFLACVAMCLPAQAAAEIFLTPLRAVLTEDAPDATFTVSNPSDRLIEVRADWIDLAATPDGYIDAIGEARSRISAAPYLTISPSRSRLKPGERAVVTVSLKKGVAFDEKERRSHLLLTAAAVRTPLRQAGGGLMADIDLAVSAPVILRSISPKSRSSFADTRLGRDIHGDLTVQTRLKRRGATSTFGALIADFSPADGSDPISAKLENVSVHFDANALNVALSLGVPRLPAGQMTLTYVGRAEYDGKILAEQSFDIAAPSAE